MINKNWRRNLWIVKGIVIGAYLIWTFVIQARPSGGANAGGVTSLVALVILSSASYAWM